MELGKRANSWVTLVLAFGCLGLPDAAGGDGFIVQPKYQSKEAKQASQPVPATPSSTPLPPSEDPGISAVGPLGPAASELPAAQGQLKWVARGSSSRTPNTNRNSSSNDRVVPLTRPLEMVNPSFVAERSAAPSLASPPTDPQTSLVQPEEKEDPRAALASLVSHQILAGDRLPPEGQSPAELVETPPGWQAVGQKLSQHITRCESLIYRGAFYSAREEAQQATLHLLRMLDLNSNQYTCEPAWNAAQRALAESEDFSMTQRLTTDDGLLRRLIQSHETPILKDRDVTQVSPLTAAQHYRLYAQKKMSEAAQGHPWAGEVFYTIGRVFQAEADSTTDNDNSAEALRWKAVTYYQAAYAVTPENALAANQLGYLLLQMDRPLDARDALIHSLRAGHSVAALENLIEASRRLGDTSTHRWAMQQYSAIPKAGPQTQNIPPVVEVDPRTFAGLSPYASGPSPQHGGLVQAATNPAGAAANY